MVCKWLLKLTLGVLESKCPILSFFLNYEKESLKLKLSLKLFSPWFVTVYDGQSVQSLLDRVCSHYLTRMSGCHTRWIFLISYLMFKIFFKNQKKNPNNTKKKERKKSRKNPKKPKKQIKSQQTQLSLITVNTLYFNFSSLWCCWRGAQPVFRHQCRKAVLGSI